MEKFDLEILISKNGRYFMMEDSVYDIALNRYANINEICFSDLIDIVGQNVAFLAEDVKTNLLEISSFTRKHAYRVLECFGETDKKLSLMMEYEVKFGTSLLTESVANPKNIVVETWGWIKEQAIILEWTLNPFNKDFYSGSNWKGVGQSAVNTAKSVGNAVVTGAKAVGNAIAHPIDTINKGIGLLKKGWQWVKEHGLGALMEKVRDALYSGVGTAVQIFLSFTGAGNIALAILWGIFLVYDLYQGFANGKWGVMNIIFDVLGIISAGAVKLLQNAVKGMNLAGKGVAGTVETLAASPATKGIMGTIKSGIGKVLEMLKSGGTWLSEKLGIKWVGEVLSKAETWLSENILKPIGNAMGLKSVGQKALKGATGEIQTVGQATRKGIVGGTRYEGEQAAIYNPLGKGIAAVKNKLAGKAAGGTPQLAYATAPSAAEVAQTSAASRVASKYGNDI
jgi:hypothetical protein